MSWKEVALKALADRTGLAYDNYYRSKSALSDSHPTTAGYKKFWEDAKQDETEAKANLK